MPKRSKANKKVKRKVKKAYKKKSYKKKYRRRLYRKKLKTKGFATKKKVGGIYKIAKGKGCKFTVYCDLAEFLALSHFDIEWLLAAAYEGKALINGDNSPAVAAYTFPSNYFKSDATEILNRIYSVFPTSLMSCNHTQTNLLQLEHMYWTAHSYPFNSRYYGPLFNTYCNMYQRIKPVGIKVSYKPNITFVNQASGYSRTDYHGALMIPSFNSTTQGSMLGNGQGGYAINETTSNNQQTIINAGTVDANNKFWSETQAILNYPYVGQELGFTPTDLKVDSNVKFPTGAQTPPILRLWVNFNKQGYEPYHIRNAVFNMEEADVSATYTDVTGKPWPSSSEHDVMQNSRYAFGRCYDEYGNQMFNSQNSPIKSYALNRPFKFYVRPFLTKKLFEPPTNTAILTNVQASNSNYVTEFATNKQNDAVSGLQKFPYISIPIINNPYGDLEDSKPKDLNSPSEGRFKDEDHANKASGYNIPFMNLEVNYQLNDDNYVNPILFSTILTCDNMLPNSCYRPFTVGKRDVQRTNKTFSTNHYVLTDYFTHSMGKFKVTFYCKFKQFNGRLKQPWINRQNAVLAEVPQTNAMVED